jgi:peptidoglycan/LPS O-acetylase OafA/YrhL
MGFSIAVLSVMALFRTAERIRLCAVLGLGIALASPLISQIDWSPVPWLVRAYLIPDYNFFGIFPWGAYLAFGMSAGSIIRTVPPDAIERSMQWAAVLGGALILACQYFANAPYQIYTKSEFWLNSPAQILTKLGVTLLLLAFAFLWTRYGAKAGWSWVRQFGTTSLLVYWIHIELVYGRASWLWKGNLNVAQTASAAVIVVLLMLVISLIKTHREQVRAMLQKMGWEFGPRVDRVSGD